MIPLIPVSFGLTIPLYLISRYSTNLELIREIQLAPGMLICCTVATVVIVEELLSCTTPLMERL
jgi:hypothetical protein